MTENKMETITITPDFESALQLAITARHGALLRCAPLPEPEATDMLAIRDIIVGLIDALGERERQIAILRLNLEDARRVLRIVASTVAEIDLGDPDPEYEND